MSEIQTTNKNKTVAARMVVAISMWVRGARLGFDGAGGPTDVSTICCCTVSVLLLMSFCSVLIYTGTKYIHTK